MAGSGKTTLLQRINSYLHTQKTPSYIINLDPAVLEVPYGANIDIRDTVRPALPLASMQMRYPVNRIVVCICDLANKKRGLVIVMHLQKELC